MSEEVLLANLSDEDLRTVLDLLLVKLGYDVVKFTGYGNKWFELKKNEDKDEDQ